MPRDIPVGNGRLLVCFDRNYCIRDLYYPHVGQENHVGGKFCRMGVWVAGQFSWVDASWQRELTYEPDTMVSKVSLLQPSLGILLICRDTVDFHEDILVREITVENLEGTAREVRLFFSLGLGIGGNDLGDTARGVIEKECRAIFR